MQVHLFKHVEGFVSEGILELTSLRYRCRLDSWGKDSKSTGGILGLWSPLFQLSHTGHFLFRHPCLYGNSAPLSTLALHLSVPPTVCAGGEAPGAGETGVPQHTQEADRVSAGPAGSRG